MTPTQSKPGLLELDKVVLDLFQQRIFDAATARCGGAPHWQQRKRIEFLTILRLGQLSQRLQVLEFDLEDELRVFFALRTPVPCEPDANGRLRLADHAVLGLRYPEEAVRWPQPGTAFVQVIAPKGVWHSNLAKRTQILCLGSRLPAGVRVKELILGAWAALTLQNLALDVLDPAGVMNPAAASYYQHHPGVIPLTREPFVSVDL